MSRRRLQLDYSSDEEEQNDYEQPTPQQHPYFDDEIPDDVILEAMETDFQTVNLNSSNPTPNTNTSATTPTTNRTFIEPIPLFISDDEHDNSNVGRFEVSDSPVNGVLETLGLRLRKEWLESCLVGLEGTVGGFQGMDCSAKAKLCFQQFLVSDMNYCGAGVLPPDVHTLHDFNLQGPFVLQVDEVVNISSALRGRYQKAAPGIKRCLKLSMTDGVQRVFGMEYRPIKDLEALALAGMKIAICNVNVRRGLLMLVPEVFEVLGGSVEELEAARQRVITEINKPPRGKRNRNGIVPPLATRATLAAWPPNNTADPVNLDRATSVNAIPSQPIAQEIAPSVRPNSRHRQSFANPSNVNNAEPNTSSVPRGHEHVEIPRHADTPTSTPLQASEQGGSSRTSSNVRPKFVAPMSRNNAEPFIFSAQRHQRSASAPGPTDEPVSHVITSPRTTDQRSMQDISGNRVPVDDVTSSVADNINGSYVDMDVEEISMVNELDHTFVFSTDNEMPFTYLASLSSKLAAIEDQGSVVRGKIKCLITGVSKFQYKRMDKYELQVSIDDGSLITQIIIDHNFIQNKVGYSPQEVTSATGSDSERANAIKETMKEFQSFLTNFEGTMMVEWSNSSPVPVATQMDQGCPASDAVSLFKRIKSYSFASIQGDSEMNPINLSRIKSYSFASIQGHSEMNPINLSPV